jgi:N-methylhydantoinase B
MSAAKKRSSSTFATKVTTFGFVWDRLISIADEAYATLIKSSFSPIVREALDATCQLFDAKGRSIAQAWAGPPSFIGTLPTTLKEILKVIPENEIKPGDILATNDPYIGTGQLNDISILDPIFSKSGKLIGYAGAVSHLPDIGGHLWAADASDVFEEGIRIPPVKLAKRGQFDKLLLNFIEANVRLPKQTVADILSDVASTKTMERLLLGVMEEYSLKDLELISEKIIETSAQTIRRDISKIPEGNYESQVSVEGFENDHSIVCKVKIRKDSIEIDYDGTSKASSFGINSPFVYTRAYTVYAAKCVVSPEVPNNQGAMDAIKVSAPKGSILNPNPPSACGARHIMGWHAPIAVWRAFAKVVPEKTIADPGLPSSCTVKGVDTKGRPFVAITVIGGGGMGARPDSDGLDTTGIPTVTSHISVEVLESTNPLLVEELRLVPDSGGAGKYRGGLGASYTIRNLSRSDAQVAFIGNKFRFPAEGLLGGMAGRARRSFVDDREVNPMGTFALRANGTITMENGGGGGFYSPLERDRVSIKDDLQNGFVTKSKAAELYGYKE